jgi:hypothetical protein
MREEGGGNSSVACLGLERTNDPQKLRRSVGESLRGRTDCLPEIRSASQFEGERAETIGSGRNTRVADVVRELERGARFSFEWKQGLIEPQFP